MANKLSSTRNNPMTSTDIESGVALGGRGSNSLDKAEAKVRPLWMRVLHRIPPQMRKNKKQHLYDPSVMSLGPYHYGEPQLRQFEVFKGEVEKDMLNGDDRRLFFRGKILEQIDDIRDFYGGLSRNELTDNGLADVMLRDACMLLFLMELFGRTESIEENIKLQFVYTYLGTFQMMQALNDMLKLENQILLWLMKSLIIFIQDDDKEGEEVLRRFFSMFVSLNPDLKKLPWENGHEYYPLHFLEAIRNIAMRHDSEEQRSCGLDISEKRSFRSVSELKAKGIYFKPTSLFVNDISFTSYGVFGVLRLPFLNVQRNTEVIFSNVIALEMSPGPVRSDYMWTSYLTFMKSMIQSVEDVKLLQEKGIIMSFTDDNEEVVRIFKEMETYGEEENKQAL